MKYFVTRSYTEHDAHSREVDAAELPALIAAYVQYLTPNSGTLIIGRTE